jgi:hypothetical protein
MISEGGNMQKKNILIAILCVTILLLVPLTNVSGASVGGLNTKNIVVEETNPVIPYYLFDELVELINQLLVDGKDVPEVVDMCNEALELIDSILQNELHDIICGGLAILFFGFGVLALFLRELCIIFLEVGFPFLGNIFLSLSMASIVIAIACLFIGMIFDCEWAWDIWHFFQDNNILKNGIGLNSQINPENISESDISAFTEFFKSHEVNGCPCMYE